MREINGCFVCGGNHRENTLHKPDKVTAAINKLKNNYLKSMLTVEDLAFVMYMADEDTHEEEPREDEEVRWIDYDEEDTGPYFASMTRENASEVERKLSNNTFIHVTSHKTDLALALQSINNQLKATMVFLSMASIFTLRIIVSP